MDLVKLLSAPPLPNGGRRTDSREPAAGSGNTTPLPGAPAAAGGAGGFGSVFARVGSGAGEGRAPASRAKAEQEGGDEPPRGNTVRLRAGIAVEDAAVQAGTAGEAATAETAVGLALGLLSDPGELANLPEEELASRLARIRELDAELADALEVIVAEIRNPAAEGAAGILHLVGLTGGLAADPAGKSSAPALDGATATTPAETTTGTDAALPSSAAGDIRAFLLEIARSTGRATPVASEAITPTAPQVNAAVAAQVQAATGIGAAGEAKAQPVSTEAPQAGTGNATTQTATPGGTGIAATPVAGNAVSGAHTDATPVSTPHSHTGHADHDSKPDVIEEIRQATSGQGTARETKAESPPEFSPLRPASAAPLLDGAEFPALHSASSAAASQSVQASGPTPAYLQVQSQAPAAAVTATPGWPGAAGTEQAAMRIVSQAVPAIVSNPERGAIEIRLEPASLGRLEITMEIVDQQLRAVVHAERPATLDLMRRHADMLTQQLQDSGFADVDVSFSDERGRFADSPAGNGAAHALTFGSEPGADAGAPLPTGPAATILPADGIDLRL